MKAHRRPITLYGPGGSPIKASSFDAASSKSRTKGWSASSLHLNAILPFEGDELRRRQAEAERKNPHLLTAREMTVSNLVGDGIVPVIRADDSGLREDVQAAWEEWVEDCDTEGCSDFYGLQAIVASTVFSTGDCFARFRPRLPSDPIAVPLQLQLLDAYMVDEQKNDATRGGKIVGGVELDPLGRRRAYWMFREHPGEMLRLGSSSESFAVPADQVCHVFHQFIAGQVRGVPWAHAVLARLYELDQYEDAEIVRKKIAAMFAGFIETPDGGNPLGPETEGVDVDDSMPLAGLEAGTIQELEEGQKITFSTPSDVGGSFEAFMRQQLRAIASGLGVTYTQLTGDLADVNFSSIRATLIEQRRRYGQIQRNMLVFQFCRRVWRRWLEAALLAGEIKIPRADRGKVLRTLMRPRWIPTPGYQWVDPEKQAKSDVLELQNGLTSRDQLIWERGHDPVRIDQERQEEKARAEELGLDPVPAATEPQNQEVPTDDESSNAAA